jgi:ABC-type transporter lipoprotein component MlaA
MTGIENFFDNLNMPIVFANDVLQGKPGAAGWDILRLVYNSTFGLGGFIDIATMVDMPENDEDFGQTLGVWGVPTGPYFVIPILGPSTVRDGTGLIVDTVAAPHGHFIPIYASVAMTSVKLLNLRSIYLEEIAASRADAFDYYIFLRNAYLQNRRAKVADQTDSPVIEEDDLYFFDDEEDYDGVDEDLDEDWDENGDTEEVETGGDETGEAEEPSDGAPGGVGPAGGDPPEGELLEEEGMDDVR